MANELSKKVLDLSFAAETKLLNMIFNHPEITNKTIDIDLFSTMAMKNVYRAIEALHSKEVHISRDTLIQEYSTIDLNADENIINLIVNAKTEDTDTPDYLLSQLADFKKKRLALGKLAEAKTLLEETARLDEEVIHEINENLFSAETIIQNKTSEEKDLKTIEDVEKTYLEMVERRAEGKKYLFKDFIFDDLVPTGALPGEIGILASASGSGKSTVCENLVNGFIEFGIPSIYYSLEMSEQAIWDRFMACRLNIPYQKIINPDEDYDSIMEAIRNEMAELKKTKCFRFSSSPDLSLIKLRKDIKQFQIESGVGYAIIVIDLLSMVRDFTKFTGGANFAQGIEVAMNELSAVAKDLGVHILGVLQLNRNGEANASCRDVDDLEKFKPNRAQIKNAGAFLERARYVLTTFRRRMYAELYLKPEEYEDMLDKIEISVVKINNGEIGKTRSGLFIGETFTILPMPESNQEEQDEMFD